MAKNKINSSTIPEDFTIGLVCVDALPVLFFGASLILISQLLSSVLFLIGALLCLWAGAAKVLWKLIVVLKKKNIWWMFLQMRIVMPIGMALMVAGCFWRQGGLRPSELGMMLLQLPSVVFFGLGVLGMILMVIFAVHLDSSDSRSNWVEQITNSIAQACFLIGLIFLYF